jgi:hypothetical protein
VAEDLPDLPEGHDALATAAWINEVLMAAVRCRKPSPSRSITAWPWLRGYALMPAAWMICHSCSRQAGS